MSNTRRFHQSLAGNKVKTVYKGDGFVTSKEESSFSLCSSTMQRTIWKQLELERKRQTPKNRYREEVCAQIGESCASSALCARGCSVNEAPDG